MKKYFKEAVIVGIAIIGLQLLNSKGGLTSVQLNQPTADREPSGKSGLRLNDGRVGIEVTPGKILVASERAKGCTTEVSCLRQEGWRFHAPRPKSAQAAWGNYDRRTTWYFGYWAKDGGTEYSENTPAVRRQGKLVVIEGDGVNNSQYYRHGGSPGLLSFAEKNLCVSHCPN